MATSDTMTADIRSIHESHRTQGQDDVIQAAAEVARDMPDVCGFVVCVWNGSESITICEPWPYAPGDIGEQVKEAIDDFFAD